jgi:GMP synthase-like glutamine amidotransferase
MKTEHFLIISNLADHPNGEVYTNGKPWQTFRKEAEKRLETMIPNQKNKIKSSIIYADKISKEEFKNILSQKFTGIIISGSPYNIDDNQQWIKQEKSVLQDLLKKNHPPILGLCFGHQILADIYGGKIAKHTKHLTGNVPLIISKNESYITYTNHEQYVSKLPENAKTIAFGPDNIPYIIEYKKNVYGVQSHPEKKSGCTHSEEFWKDFLIDFFS